MATETTMFDRIINKIAERSEAIKEMRHEDARFKGEIFVALGDAAPAESDSRGDSLVAGVHSLRAQADEARSLHDLASSDLASANRIIDELHTERALIAEKLGLVETEEAAVSDE